MEDIASINIPLSGEKMNQPSRRFTLRKGDRLHHRTLVNSLYDKGESLYVYPLRLQWRKLSQAELTESFRNEVPHGISQVQMMVTVPKRRQRMAVDRVQMRRRIREAYRLNRHSLTEAVATTDTATLSLAFVYIADKKCRYEKVERAMVALLHKLQVTLVPESDMPQ